MKMTKSYCHNHLVVTLKGQFVGETVMDHRQAFEYISLEVDNTVLFDLSKTEYIDSSGIGMLVYIYKRIKPRKLKIVLVGLNGQPKRLVEMLHINRLIECADSLAHFMDRQTEQDLTH